MEDAGQEDANSAAVVLPEHNEAASAAELKERAKQLGLKPGDEFTINLGRKHIKLVSITGQKNSDELAA